MPAVLALQERFNFTSHAESPPLFYIHFFILRADSQKAAQFIEAQDLVLEELLEETTEEEEVSVVKNEVPRTGGEADAVTAEETSADEKNDTDMEE